MDAKINEIMAELGINLNEDEIECNCGTVWVIKPDGKTYAISMMECEE